MKSRSIHSKVILILSACAICFVGLLPAQTPRPSGQSSSSPSSYGHRHLMPGDSSSGNSDSAQAPDEPTQDQLISLLTEQNKRLKAKVERLEKENAELKAKLAEQRQ